MKYIDADILRKEIERHLERATAEQEKFPDMPKYRWYLREGKKELCNDLLDYMYDTLGVEEPITDSLQQEQPEVDLENYISNKLRELGADLINHKPYSFNRGLNVGKTKAYEDILGRLNTRKEE